MLNVIPMVTIKKICVKICTKENEKGIKIVHHKISTTYEKGTNGRNEVHKRYKVYRNKQQNHRTKSFLISNYFKCKCIKLYNVNGDIGRLD